MTHSLLASRRFAPLFWRQFFAAFNDNFLKNALVLLILAHMAESGASLVTLAGAAFIAPFFLLSAIGGEFADKYDKARVVRWLSVADVAVAALSAAGFLFANLPTLFGALILFGVTGALFGPIKYGILPDHLTREELPAGNALVESATFFAILSGTIAGGAALHAGDGAILAAGVIGVAILALGAAWLIPPTGRADPDLAIDANVLRSTFKLLRHLHAQPELRRLAIVTSLFWLFGSIAMSLAPSLITQTLHGAEIVVSVHLALFAVGIAAGSGLAAFLLKGKIVLLPSAVGAALIAFGSADLGVALLLSPAPDAAAALAPEAYFAQPLAWRTAIDFLILARRRRSDDRAVLRRHSGPKRAAGTRPHRRRGQCAERRLHGARRRRRGGAAEPGRLFRGASDRSGDRRARRFGLDRQEGCRFADAGLALDLSFAPSTVST